MGRGAASSRDVSIVACLEGVQRAKCHADLFLALQDASTQLLAASSCALLVSEGVFVRRHIGKGESTLEERPSSGIVGQAFRQMCLQACPDTRKDARFDPTYDRVVPNQRVHSILAVPCLGETGLLGVFMCLNCIDADAPFTCAASTATALQLARAVAIQITSLEQTAVLNFCIRQQQQLWRVSLDLYTSACSSDENALGVKAKQVARKLLQCGDAAFLIPEQTIAAGPAEKENAGKGNELSQHDEALLRNLSKESCGELAEPKTLGWLDKARFAAKGVLATSLFEKQTVVITADALLGRGVKNALVIPVVRPLAEGGAESGLSSCGLLVCVNKNAGESAGSEQGFTDMDVKCAEQLAQSIGAVWESCRQTRRAKEGSLQQWLRVWGAETRKNKAESQVKALAAIDELSARMLAASDVSSLSQMVARDSAGCVPGAAAAGMFLLKLSRDALCCLDAHGVLQEVGLSSSAILAHTLHYAEPLRVADGGKDKLLLCLGCALHSSVVATPILDPAKNVAGVMVMAGKNLGDNNPSFFTASDLVLVQSLVGRIEVAMDHVAAAQAMRATTNLLAIGEKKWQKLQHLAALHLHSRTLTLPSLEKRAGAQTGGDAGDGLGGAGEEEADAPIVVRGFVAEGKHRFSLEQLILGSSKFVRDSLDCVDCRILLRSKDPPGKLLTVDYSTTQRLSQICAVPTAGLGGYVGS